MCTRVTDSSTSAEGGSSSSGSARIGSGVRARRPTFVAAPIATLRQRVIRNKVQVSVLGCINAKIPSTEWYGESFTTLRDLFVHSNL